MNREKIILLFGQKARFAVGGALATGVDYLIYFQLFRQGVAPVIAQGVAYSVSVIVNFLFQKYFVFEMQRSSRSTFLLSMLVSVGGLLISSGMIYSFNLFTYFQSHQLVAKLLTTGLVFFYNFYCKRYVFEKRFF
ncbi:MAG: hypothetical protein DA408_01185 [Bacteroidetes bacterium]|nr:MAG: hypothetical protein C7N36_00730 [Bacteroidota bacterium]PTM14935.1 MAG: hypothetical protein DA408_01185 [Bacteroidota bacterium]